MQKGKKNNTKEESPTMQKKKLNSAKESKEV
jgi:hypothetical protein